MAWDFVNKLFKLKPVETPDFEAMKLVWNDAAKIEAETFRIIGEAVGVEGEQIHLGSAWGKNGLDLASNDDIEIFMKCEEAFGIEIPDINPDDEKGEWSVSSLTAYIQRQFE